MKVKDYLVSQETYEVKPWGNGSILKTEGAPSNLEKYYASPDYISHSDRKKSFMEWVYAIAKRFHLNWKLRLIRKFKAPKAELLDIGAGTGDFVKAALSCGYNASGVEPGEKAREIAAAKGLELSKGIEELNHKSYDIITLWHVLEHLPKWEREIEQYYNKLNDAGLLVLALPNFKSFDAKYYGKYWAAYDVPRHLWHFSPEGIDQYIVPKGFKVIHQRMMWLDAFYVSWLSERHKGNFAAAIIGLFIGLWSNLKSLFSGHASSMIYVLEKLPEK